MSERYVNQPTSLPHVVRTCQTMCRGNGAAVAGLSENIGANPPPQGGIPNPPLTYTGTDTVTDKNVGHDRS